MVASTADLGRAAPRVSTRPAEAAESSWPKRFGPGLIAVALSGAIVGGMAVDIAPVAALATLGAIAMAVISPQVGLAILAFMAPLKPPAVIPAPGFDTVLVGAIILGCIYRFPIDRPRWRVTAPLLLLLAFVLFIAVAQLPDMAAGWVGDIGHLVGYQFFQLLTALGTVIAAGYVLSGRSPYLVLGMALAGAAFTALIACVTFLVPTAGTPLANLIVATTDGTRATGPFGNPNYLGVFAALALAGAAGLAFTARSWTMRAVLSGTAILIAAGLAVSLSRGAFVAGAVGVAVVLLSRSRRFGIAALLVGALAALVIYPAFVEARLVSETGAASAAAYAATAESDAGRLMGVLAGPQIFLSSPLVGVGFGHYAAMSVIVGGTSVPIDAHNWYMNVLAEEGLVGIVLWVLLQVAIVLELRKRPARARTIGLAVLAALAAGSLFLEPPTSYQTVALPCIFLVAALVAEWGPRAERLADPGPAGPSLAGLHPWARAQLQRRAAG